MISKSEKEKLVSGEERIDGLEKAVVAPGGHMSFFNDYKLESNPVSSEELPLSCHMNF